MKRTTCAIAVALTLAPGIASAMRCSHGPAKMQTMSCAEGTQFDAETGGCIPLKSS